MAMKKTFAAKIVPVKLADVQRLRLQAQLANADMENFPDDFDDEEELVDGIVGNFPKVPRELRPPQLRRDRDNS